MKRSLGLYQAPARARHYDLFGHLFGSRGLGGSGFMAQGPGLNSGPYGGSGAPGGNFGPSQQTNGYTMYGGGGIPQQQGGGIDWAKVLMGGGMLLGGAADLYGAHQQGEVNQQNLAAQQAQQAMINGLVGQYMTPAGQQNPYASQMMNFLGMPQQGQQPQQTPTQQPTRPRGLAGLLGGHLPTLGSQGEIATEGPGFSGSNQGGGMMYSDVPPANIHQRPISPLLTNPPNFNSPQAQSGHMYQYNNPAASTYQAAQVGQAPQVQAPQMAGLGQLNPAQASGQGQVQAPQIGMPDQVAVNTQGFNAGQDGLLQMMRKDIQAPRDSSIDPMLQSGTGQFDNSALFKALAPQDQQLLDEQVNQLRGSAGSFGQRFGSKMMQDEQKMRTQFATNVGARNAGIQQQSFENAAGRNLQGAGIQAGREQFFGNQPFQNAQLQLQAAQGVQQGGLQGAGLDLQGQQFNVGQNQGAQQFNAGNSMQAQLANQQLGQQNNQFNAGLQQQAGQFNIGNQLSMLQGNQQAALQAMLANQGLAGQYGLANQNALNQAGQFNANQQQNQNQFGAQQGNIYNQLMMSGMMNASQLGQQQFGNNAQLLGILAGLSVPQAQVNPMYGAIGNAATTMGMLPMMYQMMGR